MPPGGAPPGGPPSPGPPPTPGGGAPSGPGGMAAFARSRMGPQISTPGPGNQADSSMLLQQAVQLIQQAALGLEPGSQLHRDALRAATQLSRHLGGAGGMGAAVGVQKTMLGDQMKRTVQNQLLQRLFGQGKPPGGGQPGQPPGGGGAPMPSTPLPGA